MKDNNNLKNISFNYYANASSYVKTVLDLLPDNKVSKEKKAIIIEIFNYILSSLDEDKIRDFISISEVFNEKLSVSSNQEIILQIEYLYRNFLNKMLFDSYNRMTYFNIMNECVKVYVGYYSEYENNDFYEVNDTKISNIRIR